MVVEDFAHSTLQLCDTPIDLEFMEKLPAAAYGFPCGFHKEFLAERAKIPETLFDLKYVAEPEYNIDENRPLIRDTLMNVSQMALTACNMCDIDIRAVNFLDRYNN